MKYRIAKPCDAEQIANIHFAIRESYSVGIFAQLGKPFLLQYYKIILNDKNQVIICAEDKKGNIHGFCSATLDVESQFENIRKHKFSLGFAAIGSIVTNLSLLKALIYRYKSTLKDESKKFISIKGARDEYWAWTPENKDSISSFEMHQVHMNILKDLGVDYLHFEVDTINKRIFRFHKHNHAELIETIILPDGRERALMRYNLQ